MKKNKYDLFLVLKKLKKNKLLNNLTTLNEEKKRLKLVKKTLNEMLNDNNNSETEGLGSEIKFKAAFRSNLLNKLEISNNREGHIDNEIKTNLSEIGKIEKQKEKIKSRKKINQVKKNNLLELKKESFFKPKNIPYI